MFKRLRIIIANLIAPKDFGCMNISNLYEVIVTNEGIPKAQYNNDKQKDEINNSMGINFGVNILSKKYADIITKDNINAITKEPTVDISIRAFIYIPTGLNND